MQAKKMTTGGDATESKERKGSEETNQVQQQLDQALEQIRQLQESERRALADYQNLVRRNREERASFVKYANKELVEGLLEPLSHLELAAVQMNDAGLNMVIGQFWQKLEEFGLTKHEVLGQPFDVHTMEVAETEDPAEVVVKVHRPALLFNGEVLQHARVVLGPKK